MQHVHIDFRHTATGAIARRRAIIFLYHDEVIELSTQSVSLSKCCRGNGYQTAMTGFLSLPALQAKQLGLHHQYDRLQTTNLTIGSDSVILAVQEMERLPGMVVSSPYISGSLLACFNHTAKPAGMLSTPSICDEKD